MVQFQCLSIFLFIAAHKAKSDLLSDESKVKFVIKTMDTKAATAYNKYDFQCDLTLLPQQKKLMYFGARSDASAADLSYDLYRWPKNKNGHVIVPYAISRTSQCSSKQFRFIRKRFGLSDGDIRRINTKYNCKVNTHGADFIAKPEYHVKTGIGKLFSKPYYDNDDDDDDDDDDDAYDDDDELSDI